MHVVHREKRVNHHQRIKKLKISIENLMSQFLSASVLFSGITFNLNNFKLILKNAILIFPFYNINLKIILLKYVSFL